MLITCEKCNGMGLDNDIPKKRCVDCGGKGTLMVPDASYTVATPNEEKFAEVLPIKKKPWYKF